MEEISDVGVSFYENLLGKNTEVNTLALPNLITRKLNEQQADDLVKPIAAKEIKEALFSIPDENSSGPDGYNALFYKDSWPVVGEDVIEAVLSFFDNSKMHEFVNSVALALIPKVKNVEDMRNFRPISCCNVIYKVAPKQVTIVPPSSSTTIKIEVLKDDSSSSASSTSSESPPPSPRMGDRQPPPPLPPAPRTMADFNKLSGSSFWSSIGVPHNNVDPDYEIKIPFLGSISRDVQFEGKPHDNPCTHLANFLAMCETFKSGNLDKNTLCLRAFPLSLRGAAKRWLNSKPPDYYTNWDDLTQDFVEEYFPPSRTTAYKDNIVRFVQKDGVSLYDVWNEFQKLLYNFPHHGFEQRQLAEIIARGMNEESVKWVNPLAEGDCTALTPEATLLHFARCSSKSKNWKRKCEGAKS
ncbi:LINE-1 retrotransposable element ORF2 protein [Linum perenne]